MLTLFFKCITVPVAVNVLCWLILQGFSQWLSDVEGEAGSDPTLAKVSLLFQPGCFYPSQTGDKQTLSYTYQYLTCMC